MKKEYFKPELEEVKVYTESLLASLSVEAGGSDGGDDDPFGVGDLQKDDDEF